VVGIGDGGEYLPAVYNGWWIPVIRYSGEHVDDRDLMVDV